MTADDLVKLIHDGLADAGKASVPTVPPATAISKLPAVVVAPSSDELTSGNKTLRYGFDITVTVPRQAQVSQYPLLSELEGVVLQALVHAGSITFEGPIIFAVTGGGDTGEPPAMSRVIPISVPSNVSLC